MVQNLPNVQSLNCANVDTCCRTEQLNSGGFEVFLPLSSFARDVFCNLPNTFRRYHIRFNLYCDNYKSKIKTKNSSVMFKRS